MLPLAIVPAAVFTVSFSVAQQSVHHQGQKTTRVSINSLGVEGNDDCYQPVLSADGMVVAFHSVATNLVVGDTNGTYDVFVHDRRTGITKRVSVSSSGVESNGASGNASLSADGMIVAYGSNASNLVDGDTNGFSDVFVYDRSTGITERVSVRTNGQQGNGYCSSPTLSADGQIVAFYGAASNLVSGDTNNQPDVFVHDRSSRITKRVSVDSSGGQGCCLSFAATISADGLIVAFTSSASDLIPGDTNSANDVLVHDRTTGITDRVSVSSSGEQGDRDSSGASISADGQIVAFYSYASTLVAKDTNGDPDVFVHDRSTGITKRVSVDSSGAQGNGISWSPCISANGQMVAFGSSASNLIAGDVFGFPDAFVHDRVTKLTTRVSVASLGEAGWDGSSYPSISADAQFVTFESQAPNLVEGDRNRIRDIFVRDLR